jgi:hypothetical protein
MSTALGMASCKEPVQDVVLTGMQEVVGDDCAEPFCMSEAESITMGSMQRSITRVSVWCAPWDSGPLQGLGYPLQALRGFLQGQRGVQRGVRGTVLATISGALSQ